jgi:hypothetical protein
MFREPAIDYHSVDGAADTAFWAAAFDILVRRHIGELSNRRIMDGVVADADRILNDTARRIDIEAMIRKSLGDEVDTRDLTVEQRVVIEVGVMAAIVRQMNLSRDETGSIFADAEDAGRRSAR